MKSPKVYQSVRYSFSLEVPKFTDSEKVTMKSIMISDNGKFKVEYWGKVHDYLLWMLAQGLLNGRLSEDARKGYMACLHTLDNLPIYDVDTADDVDLDDVFSSMPKDF